MNSGNILLQWKASKFLGIIFIWNNFIMPSIKLEIQVIQNYLLLWIHGWEGFFPTLTGGENVVNRNSALLAYFVEFGKRGKAQTFFF